MNKDESSNININKNIIHSLLKALAETRIERGGWFDSEEEEVEQESLVFKIAESIKPFLFAFHFNKSDYPIFLEEKILNEDIKKVLIKVQKIGFYPSPYSPIPDVDDQYMDFAAFMLEFCDLVYDYAKDKNNQLLVELSKTIAKKAYSFITKVEHFLTDDQGSRWAGTNLFSRKRRIVEYYTDTYFTSIVIIALRKVLEKSVLSLNEKEKDKVRRLIRQAGKWIINRADADLLTGDEAKSIKKLIYTTWGVRALVETFDNQDDDTRRKLVPIATKYIKTVDIKREKDSVSLGQEYLTILSPEVETPLYYEDRSDWGGIFLTLLSLRKFPNQNLESTLDTLNYQLLLDAINNDLILLRDPTSKLWYKGKLILSIHSYLIEGFLLYGLFTKEFGTLNNITVPMIRRAIKESLNEDQVVISVQQIFYNKLLAIVNEKKTDQVIDQQFENILKEKEIRPKGKTETRVIKPKKNKIVKKKK